MRELESDFRHFLLSFFMMSTDEQMVTEFIL